MSNRISAEPSRRSFLGLAGAIAPALLLPQRSVHAQEPGGGVGRPNSYRLVPDHGENWALHKTDPDAGVVQLPSGVNLFSAGQDTELPVIGRGVALWARTPIVGDFKAMFHYTRTDALQATTSAGCATLFYWATVGRVPSDPDWPADVSAWSAFNQAIASDRVEDSGYIAHANGIRISFNTFNTPNPSLSNQVRLVAFQNGAITARLTPDNPQNIAFPTDQTFKVTLRRQGTFFTFTAEAEDGTVAQNTFTSPIIASYTEGWAGFRLQPSRRVRIENFVMIT
jgi:hypothetical protein